MAAVGGDILIAAGHLDQGGKGIIQASLDSGAFDQFFLPDGGAVDYVGASAVELVGAGESAGNYRQMAVEGGKLVTVRCR